MRRRIVSAAEPNPAHFALAKLERTLQDRLFLCSQNVDNLHEQAGAKNVVHMDGELFKSRCDSCSRLPFEDANIYRGASIPWIVTAPDNDFATAAVMLSQAANLRSLL